MCEHEVVLAIYKERPHTKYNISHFRCPKCGEIRTSEFGYTIIHDHQKRSVPKRSVEK